MGREIEEIFAKAKAMAAGSSLDLAGAGRLLIEGKGIRRDHPSRAQGEVCYLTV